MKEYKKPLVEVHELRLTENIAAKSTSLGAKWAEVSGNNTFVTSYLLLNDATSTGLGEP